MYTRVCFSHVNSFQETEKCYYYDQLNLRRKMLTTGEVDEEYEKEFMEKQFQIDVEVAINDAELRHALEDDEQVGGNVLASASRDAETTVADLSFSITRSGKVRKTDSRNDAGTQTEYIYQNTLPLRHGYRQGTLVRNKSLVQPKSSRY